MLRIMDKKGRGQLEQEDLGPAKMLTELAEILMTGGPNVIPPYSRKVCNQEMRWFWTIIMSEFVLKDSPVQFVAPRNEDIRHCLLFSKEELAKAFAVSYGR